MTDTWHADGALLRRYAAGNLAAPAALSIEAHLVGCAVCQSAAAAHVDAARLATVWRAVEDMVDAPRRTAFERLLHRIGMAESTARLLVATPALRAPWVATVSLLLLMTVLGGPGLAGERGDLLLLLLAPVVPVVGTALVFGSRTDITAEVTIASPVSNLWLVLVRTASVLVTSVLLSGVASMLAPSIGWRVLGWLIPALALTALTLALASRLRAASSAAIVATLWVVGVAGNEAAAAGGLRGLRAGGAIQAAVFRPAGQLVLVVVAMLAAAVIAIHRDDFEIDLEGSC